MPLLLFRKKHTQQVQASALATLAQSLASKEALPLTTPGFNDGAIFRNSGTGSILEYTAKAVWDPVRKVARFIGDSHTPQVSGMVSYDDATNTFTRSSVPWDGSISHGYDHTAIRQNGEVYHHLYNSATVYRYRPALSQWDAITSIPMTGFNIVAPLEFFPDRDSLVLYEVNNGLFEYSFSTGQWTNPSGPLANLGSYNNQSKYDAVSRAIVLVGSGSNSGYRYNANGTLTSISAGGVGFATPGDGAGAILTQDPASGRVIAFNWSRQGYEFDGSAFVSTGYTLPAAIAQTEGGVFNIQAAPVSTYGVVLLVGAGSSGGGDVYVYKH